MYSENNKLIKMYCYVFLKSTFYVCKNGSVSNISGKTVKDNLIILKSMTTNKFFSNVSISTFSCFVVYLLKQIITDKKLSFKKKQSAFIVDFSTEKKITHLRQKYF
jgi:hypothetical protein